MHATGFAKLLGQFQGLSVDQICQAKEALKDQEGQREGLFVIREKEQSVTCCPRCSAAGFVSPRHPPQVAEYSAHFPHQPNHRASQAIARPDDAEQYPDKGQGI